MGKKDDIDEAAQRQYHYLYVGPKFLADQKLRLGKWLEERRRG